MERVLLPLDGSMLSERSMSTAADVARALGVPVTVVRVVAPLESIYLADGDHAAGLDRVIGEMEEEAQGYVEAKARQMEALGVAAEGRVLHGYPSTQLLDLAQRHPHGLFVMTTHGRSGIGRVLLGSVTDRVARASGAPVLILRP